MHPIVQNQVLGSQPSNRKWYWNHRGAMGIWWAGLDSVTLILYHLSAAFISLPSLQLTFSLFFYSVLQCVYVQGFNWMHSHYKYFLCNLCAFFFWLLFYFYSFLFGCAGSSLVHVGFLWFQIEGLLSHCSTWDSQPRGFSCGPQALACRLSSCGAWA